MSRRLSALVCALLLLLSVGGDAWARTPVMGFNDLMQYIVDRPGKVVLVNLWATWCGPCLKEMPGLMRFREQTPEEHLDMIGISFDFDPEALEAFLADNPINYPQYLAGPELMRIMNVDSLPRTLLYDQKGLEVLRHEGYISVEELCREVRGQIAKMPKCGEE